MGRCPQCEDVVLRVVQAPHEPAVLEARAANSAREREDLSWEEWDALP